MFCSNYFARYVLGGLFLTAVLGHLVVLLIFISPWSHFYILIWYLFSPSFDLFGVLLGKENL